VFGSLRIVPREDEAMENLTLYIIRGVIKALQGVVKPGS
jgi:hypothetical protein